MEDERNIRRRGMKEENEDRGREEKAQRKVSDMD